MKKVASLALFLFLIGCGGGTQYLDVEKAEGSGEWGPKEIKMTANKMVTSLYTFLKDEYKKPAFIQVKKFRNKTSEHIDTEQLISEIRKKLIQKKIKFIDDSLEADALKEMEKGMTGLVDPDSAIPVGNLKSPNFYLTGEINDKVDYNRKGRKVQYIKVILKLIDPKTNLAPWEDSQEFLKSSKTDQFSF